MRESLPTCRKVDAAEVAWHALLGGVEAFMAAHFPKSSSDTARGHRWV